MISVVDQYYQNLFFGNGDELNVFDGALGQWRDKIGEEPVDAASVLFNKDELRGMKGLKDYLLANRQDQFARAMAHKMAAYALGRPLTFGDRAEVDRITAALRQRGDGLVDLVFLIVKSDLFQLK